MNGIGERIKAVRKSKGFTQQAFSERLGLKRNTIASYEIGAGSPSDRTISDICREFGVNEDWLRTGEGTPFREESREEQILRFASQTVKGSDEFRKAFVSMLAKMDAQDWEALARLFDRLSADLGQDGPPPEESSAQALHAELDRQLRIEKEAAATSEVS